MPPPNSAPKLSKGFGFSFRICGFARDLKLNAAEWHERSKVPNPEGRAGLERRSVKSSGCRSGSCNPSESGSGSVYGDPSGSGSPWTIDLMSVGSGEWQLASSLVSLMSGGSGEWQLASGWISRMNDGSSEWQVASSLLS